MIAQVGTRKLLLVCICKQYGGGLVKYPG